MADGAPPPNTPPAPDADLSAAVEQLRTLVDLTRLQTDLIRATNYLLISQADADHKTAFRYDPTTAAGVNPATLAQPGRATQSDPALLDILHHLATRDLAPAKSGTPQVTLADVLGRQTAPGWTQPHGGPAKPRMNPARGLGRWASRVLQRGRAGTRMARWGKTAQQFGRGLAKTLRLGDKAGQRLGQVGAVAGGAVGAAVDVAAAFIKVRDAVAQMTDAAMETAKRLSSMSGGMAAVVAMREVDQMMRDMKRGDATSDSARRLQIAESQRKDEENKIQIAIDNLTNEVLIIGNGVMTKILKGLNEGVDGVATLVKWFTGIDIRGATDPGVLTADTLAADARRGLAAAEVRGRDLMEMARREARDGAGVPRMPGA